MTPFVIAVDGPAASGKGTVAARLGDLFGLPVLDTGLLYRAVGVLTERAGGDLDDAAAAAAVAAGLSAAQLGDPALRTRAAGELASRVAVHQQVRDALLAFQRDFAGQPGGAVLDGRDIGTVICPGAPAKLYVTATPEVRAERRWKQLSGQGEPVGYADVLADIRRRDERDGARDAAPMTQAPDAELLDTTEMTIEQAADAARRIVEAARARWQASEGTSGR
ncbi:MAG: (d)CMP kinase [Phenylobacterium sp.]|uniref:(d)CMP kinase n=1 Tax=Phenylobacterium sp. TaxID=1871053 RepID=UPI001A3CD401|nr:(d)CMP kinase [Phenylobacterium sp.]MBL8770509.1 (d)CMP kinase [Phenylobacterium sp.]